MAEKDKTKINEQAEKIIEEFSLKNVANTKAYLLSGGEKRRVEMAMEHDRFFDLVRTGQAEAAFAIDGKTFVTGKHELFPLPQAFITQSKGLSAQNPGY